MNSHRHFSFLRPIVILAIIAGTGSMGPARAAGPPSADVAPEQDCAAVPDGLLHWWTFDEQSDGAWVDLVSGNDLTNSTVVLAGPTAGVVAGAASVPAGAALRSASALSPGLGNFSIDAWVRPEGAGTFMTILGSNSRPDYSGFWLGTYGGTWELQIASNGVSERFQSTAPIMSDWQFLAVAVDSADGIVQFTVDGVTEPPLPFTQLTPGATNLVNSRHSAVAEDIWDARTNTTTLLIDELEYFGDVVSASEFTAIYDAGPGGKCKPSPPDATAPAVTITSPGDGDVYVQGDSVTADYACTDDGSGVASCVGDGADGAEIDTAVLGLHDFTVTATDTAGNEASATHSYTVIANTPPTEDACKRGGWKSYTDDRGASFRNQGDCVSYVSTGGRNTAGG